MALTESIVKLVRWSQKQVTTVLPSSVTQPSVEKPPYPSVRKNETTLCMTGNHFLMRQCMILQSAHTVFIRIPKHTKRECIRLNMGGKYRVIAIHI